jgi:hypothetical protein
MSETPTLSTLVDELRAALARIDRERDQAMLEPRCQPEKIHLAYIRKLANTYAAYVEARNAQHQ